MTSVGEHHDLARDDLSAPRQAAPSAAAPSAVAPSAAPPVDAPPSRGARRRRGRPRDPRTDLRITTAASELMLERGFDKMTVDDVAERAGVGKATVYRRWSSKDDLAIAAMQQLYDSEIPEPDTGSIVTDLQQSFTSVLTFLGTPEGAAYLRTSIAESIRDERIAALYRASTERAESQARRMYERAVARGEVRADLDIDVAVQWLGGLLVARAITDRPLPTVDEVPALVEFALRGIRA